MELLNNLSLGFETAFTLQNLMYCFIGCVLGTLIGVLPGLGPLQQLPCFCRQPTHCLRSLL